MPRFFVLKCRHADRAWHVTDVRLDHYGCAGLSGGIKKRAGGRAMREEAKSFVNPNHKITSPALVKTLKASSGVAMVRAILWLALMDTLISSSCIRTSRRNCSAPTVRP